MATSLQWVQSWNGSVLSWTETWGEGGSALSVVSAGSLGFGSRALHASTVSFAPVGSVTFLSSSYAFAAINLSGSFSGLFEGMTLGQPAALSIPAVASFTFLSSAGSAFDIHGDQTVMSPAAGAIANAAVVASSSAVPIWLGSDAQNFKAFSIAATANLAFAGVQIGGAEFAPVGTVAVTFAASPLYRTDFTIAAAATATPWSAITLNPRGALWNAAGTAIFDPYSRASGAFGVAATGLAEFGQTAGAVSQGAFNFVSSGAIGFTGNSKAITAVDVQARLSGEFGQPGGGVEFGALVLTHQLTLNFGAESKGNGNFRVTSRGTFDFSSTEFVEIDDDLKADADPRAIWEAAAQQEAWERDRRKLKRIARIDEDDLLTLSAALSQAISQATTRGVAAR